MHRLLFPLRSAQFKASLWNEAIQLHCREWKSREVLPLHTHSVSCQELAHRTSRRWEPALFSCFTPLRKICLVTLNLFNDTKLDRTMIWQLTTCYCDELPGPLSRFAERPGHSIYQRILFISKVLDPPLADSTVCPGARRHQISLRKYLYWGNQLVGW